MLSLIENPVRASLLGWGFCHTLLHEQVGEFSAG
jgi:hypothetical protein